MGEYPREGLFRMTAWTDARATVESDETRDDGRLGTFHGYAAMFNEATTIRSWEGEFVERIAPGAFAKSIQERGERVKALFNHGFDPQIGDKPLGKIDVLREDELGLYVEFGMDDTSYNRDLIASLRSGALDGMSFQFSVTRDDWEHPDDGLPVRTLKEVKLYEVGPVTFPAYEATTAGVRSREGFQAWRQSRFADDDAADSGTSLSASDAPASATRRHQERYAALKRRIERQITK